MSVPVGSSWRRFCTCCDKRRSDSRFRRSPPPSGSYCQEIGYEPGPPELPVNPAGVGCPLVSTRIQCAGSEVT